MSETLTQRKREMLKRCTDAAQQLGKPVLFGMTTSLILQSVPLPKDCDCLLYTSIPDCRAHCPSAVRRDVRGFGMRQTVPSAPTW